LADDATRRQNPAHAAHLDAMARFGPQEGPIGLHGVL
jgi:hypothetical protein